MQCRSACRDPNMASSFPGIDAHPNRSGRGKIFFILNLPDHRWRPASCRSSSSGWWGRVLRQRVTSSVRHWHWRDWSPLRVHLHRSVDLRLGSAAQRLHLTSHLAGGHRGEYVGIFHHHRQLVHAASRGALKPGRAELDSIVLLFTNNTGIAAFWHAVAASFLTAATFVSAVCAW